MRCIICLTRLSNSMDARQVIKEGQAVLGIEFGSTRIKAVLVDPDGKPVAQGSHEWENRLEGGLWTYSEEDIWGGLQDCYASLRADVQQRYGVEIESLAAAGVSAMMHGYLAFDKAGALLVPFRTWRNTNTGPAAKALSELFDFNMPLRWSLSHLYQCILDGETHVPQVDFFTTLAGFVHWRLTGRKVLGVGDASGMMPIDPATGDFDERRIAAFDKLVASKAYPWHLRDILPEVLPAGVPAGVLTEEGARLLDPSGHLRAGIPFCPPEGDAGTGMTATNAVRPRTGNVSAGTSSFSMIVLERDLKKPNEMIDVVTTPDGAPVAMVHCNNCTSEINAWAGVFREFQELMGGKADMGAIFDALFRSALDGDADCGGLLAYNYLSGEPVTGLTEGRPLFVRSAADRFNLANFMRSQLYGAVGVLKIGNDVLFREEGVGVDRITGHGGFFKTPVAGQKVLAAALGSPISVMETAGEGGPWGMALLASYMIDGSGETLPDYLDGHVFADAKVTVVEPSGEDIEGFNVWLEKYRRGLSVEHKAVETV